MKPHESFRYRRSRTPQEQREFRAAQRRRVTRRWEKARAAFAGEPIRAPALVRRITDEAPWRCRQVIEAWAEPCLGDRARVRVLVNGEQTRFRTVGAAIRALARCL